jgi:predicted nucleic acid-binding protein
MTRIVLDCSIAMAWCFEDEASPVADAVLASLAEREAAVPSLWPLEVANVLVLGERRGRITAAKAGRFLSLLSSLPIRVDDYAVHQAISELLNLARLHNLTAYDAAYLELAIREGGDMATLDDRLRQAAVNAGVRLFEVPSP